jgi:hypothetical protein
MTRTDIINKLIKKNNYKTYLEIGVNTPNQPGYNWINVDVQLKHGVDPNVDTTYKVTSDVFFEKYIPHKYDLIFVDGLHTFEQSYKDIINSLAFLNENGTIVVHDCNPINEISQRPIRESNEWNGDVWKSILKLRLENKDLQIYTVDTDYGCSVIKKGRQDLLKPENNMYDYFYFEKNKNKILNLISVNEFILKFV